MPVGPPWITTSSGYRFPAWKPTGLCRTPSIAAPSWLFQVMSSGVRCGHDATCADMAVNCFAAIVASGAIPFFFHATSEGTSSNPLDTLLGAPPSADTTATYRLLIE